MHTQWTNMKNLTRSMAMVMGMLVLIACGGDDKQPTQVKDQKKSQDNVYHVFNEDLAQAKEQAEAAQEPLEVEVETSQDLESVQANKDTPLYVIQKYTEELQALDQETKTSSNRDQLIAQKVRRFFDFQTLAKESLGTHWYQINANERQEYSDLFISLIERSYLSRSKDLVGSYDVRFENETIEKQKAKVSCIVEKEDVDIDITYELHRKRNKWMIYNIVFDQVDLVQNYQSQFGRIIAKSKFTGLVKAMRNKLNAEDDIQVQL